MTGPVASRWWRWLRGAGPLEILPGRPLPAATAWLFALGLSCAVAAGAPPRQTLGAVASGLAVEALLVAVALLAAKRGRLIAQALQAAGLLAGLRNLLLAPLIAVLFMAREGAGPGLILALFVPLGLATVLAMAWLVRRYLALWREALRTTATTAGAVLLALALALLLAEAVLARAFAEAPPTSAAARGSDAGVTLG